MDLASLGRVLILLGLLIAGLGFALIVSSRLPFLGRLPGDFVTRWDGGGLYVPLATSLLISIVLTIVLNLVLRLFSRS